MKTQVHFFKPTGKRYETEEIDVGLEPWEARALINAYLAGRFAGMTAVVIDGPWGFPISFPRIGENA